MTLEAALGKDAQVDEDAQIDERVSRLWGLIIKSINDVLNADKYYGFAHFKAFADPSIDQILNAIQIVEPLVETILNSKHFSDDTERTMALLNCQQSIHLIHRTHVSLKDGDETEYEDCIHKLQSQRQY